GTNSGEPAIVDGKGLRRRMIFINGDDIGIDDDSLLAECSTRQAREKKNNGLQHLSSHNFSQSESNSRAQLDFTRSICLLERCNLSKGGRGDAGGWTGKDHTVRRVEHFHTEAHKHSLCESYIFLHESIEVPAGRPIDVRKIARSIAEPEGWSLRKR